MAEKDMFLFGLVAALAAAVEVLIESHPNRKLIAARIETTLALGRAFDSDGEPDPEYERAVDLLATRFREVGTSPRT